MCGENILASLVWYNDLSDMDRCFLTLVCPCHVIIFPMVRWWIGCQDDTTISDIEAYISFPEPDLKIERMN